MIGEFLYYPIETIVGESLAPKITGMMIDQPVEEL